MIKIRKPSVDKKLAITSAAITKDVIQQKAYEIYQATGNTDAVQNWVEAEKLLKG